VSISRKRLLILAAALLGAAVTAGAGAVYALGGGATGGAGAGGIGPAGSVSLTDCKITKADFITNAAGTFSTASGSFVAIPGMTKAVKVGGKTSSCVLVAVSGDSLTTSGEQEVVGVTLDGALGDPGGVVFSMNDPNAAQEHAALFAFPRVAPGNHTVVMVFKSSFGGTVLMTMPAMRIDHR
jgi:hypothetical protein